ncbi:MAG: F-type H+-transporting ATPase subunit a [Actinomycetota bacterium]|jgi:F-type H+-transporting ATPase subunit a|nr:F-type H+-transporting ATPase subunit a [Actinomycetota bacterium]
MIGSSSASRVVAATIDVGTHPEAKILGLTINTDTVISTLIAGAIVVGLGLYMAARAQSGVPSKLQLIFETVVDAVNKQVEESMGIKVAPFVVPLAVTLFFFILLSNWIGLIPSGHPEKLPAPTADINLTLAMAFAVIVPLHIVSIRRRGLKAYIKHYFQPYPIMFPINLIEELVKPFTLALRLFGNLISGAIMVALLGLLPAYALWAPQGAWKLIDMAVGVIQAFIFALLTILYFAFATTTDHGPDDHAPSKSHDDAHSTSHDDESTSRESPRVLEPSGSA